MCHIRYILRNIVNCDSIKAYPAFGPPVQTKGLGQYGPLGLDMILIDDMKETLVSISELCKGGLLNKQNLVVFTWEGMRGFKMNEASRRAMKTRRAMMMVRKSYLHTKKTGCASSIVMKNSQSLIMETTI